MLVQPEGDLPYGELQGEAPGGIKAFSNGSDLYFSGERDFDGPITTGMKFQCVMFVRKYLLERKGVLIPDLPYAAMIFTLSKMELAATGEDVPVVAVRNKGKDKPVADSLLIYESTDLYPQGHAAAIVEVGEHFVRIADQNNHFGKWKGGYYSEELTLEHDTVTGTYTIHAGDGSIPLGWVTVPSVPNRDATQPLTFAAKYKRPTFAPYMLERAEFTPKPVDGPWLDTTNEAEKKFVEEFGVDLSRTRLAESKSNYYRINLEAWFALTRAGTQVHQMAMAATKRVLGDDNLFDKFGIPKELWPKIRRSFERTPYQITGRFDFVINEDGSQLKMFEYNADSASTLLECGVIQEKWAKAVGIDKEASRSCGARMSVLLERAWADMITAKVIPKGAKVHFCVDNDGEEMYTAMYCMQCARAAGLEAELVVMFDKLTLKEEGKIYDQSGTQVKYIWKTWNWESGISDWKKSKTRTREKPTQVFLADLLFSPNDDIVIFEPMWKLIPGNKAILPILWEMYPNHPNLLRTHWEVTPELKKTGYARKPIVGRTGQNVTIVGPGGDVMGESTGNYADRDLVYQELFKLPKRNEYFGILGGWIVGGYYGGTGVREDKGIITNLDSPFSAIRVEFDYGNNEMPSPTKVTHAALDEQEQQNKK